MNEVWKDVVGYEGLYKQNADYKDLYDEYEELNARLKEAEDVIRFYAECNSDIVHTDNAITVYNMSYNAEKARTYLAKYKELGDEGIDNDR